MTRPKHLKNRPTVMIDFNEMTIGYERKLTLSQVWDEVVNILKDAGLHDDLIDTGNHPLWSPGWAIHAWDVVE